jgi:hypothetical protein
MLRQQPAPVAIFPPAPRLSDQPVDTVPASWAQFAQLVQGQFKALLDQTNGPAPGKFAA